MDTASNINPEEPFYRAARAVFDQWTALQVFIFFSEIKIKNIFKCSISMLIQSNYYNNKKKARRDSQLLGRQHERDGRVVC
jgi:hypothetical protein